MAAGPCKRHGCDLVLNSGVNDRIEAEQLAFKMVLDAVGSKFAASFAFALGKQFAKNAVRSSTPFRNTVIAGGLRGQEAAGGHLLEFHVGMSQTQLAARNLPFASTFSSGPMAEAAVSSTIYSNQAAIQTFLSGSHKTVAIEQIFSSAVGTSLLRGASNTIPAHGARIILIRDQSSVLGYRILTGFPFPVP